MKVYQTNEIKNIALLGSAGSGKTTLAESMVYEAGIRSWHHQAPRYRRG